MSEIQAGMKTVLIIYPHWPPSNLVGVHRVRLIANHLSAQEWHPIVLTVHQKHYEETSIPELESLVDDSVEVIKTEAKDVFKLFGKRLVGDIGLRGWTELKSTAKAILEKRTVDFIWFSMPSWYPPLMAGALKRQFNIRIGIDYQDPWVQKLPDGTAWISRARMTQWLARRMEPYVLREMSLITAINASYISGIRERHPELDHIPRATFQLGFDEKDHQLEVKSQSLWPEHKQCLIYAGAFLPLSAPFHRALFKATRSLLDEGLISSNILFLYVGTGHPDRPVQRIAAEEGITSQILEIPERISFLEIQQLLRKAYAAMVIGSPEPHYSASKVFQCVLSQRPVLGILHEQSEASTILEQCGWTSMIAKYRGNEEELVVSITKALANCLNGPHPPLSLAPLEPHHARNAAKVFADAMNSIVAT